MQAQGGLVLFLDNLHARYGSIARFWGGLGDLSVSINDPKLLERVDANKLEKRLDGLNFLKGLLGARGIGYTSGAQAKVRRQLWHSVLSGQPFQQSMLPAFNSEVKSSLDGWTGMRNAEEKEALIEFNLAARMLWLRLNQVNAFGCQAGEGATDLFRAFGEAVQLLQRLRYSAFPTLPWSPAWREKRRLLSFIHMEVDRLIQATVSREPQGKESHTEWGSGDLLSLLIAAKKQDGTPAFSPAEVHDEVLTLLFGVYDNSKILSHTLHQLACHPGAQQAARDEVDTAWGGQPPRTLQALISLKYLHACLQESLRISAGRGVIWRVLEKDVRLGNYVLPKGATLVAPTAAIHSNPNYWPEPSKFRPERFLDAEPSASGTDNLHPIRHPGGHALAFIPFGFGLRNCLGQKYALNTATLVLGHILQGFTVELPSEADRQLHFKEENLSLESTDGIHLRMIPRKKQMQL
ncbi:g8742 [Coccomyxa elongata]